jgi:hypothetical protein
MRKILDFVGLLLLIALVGAAGGYAFDWLMYGWGVPPGGL